MFKLSASYMQMANSEKEDLPTNQQRQLQRFILAGSRARRAPSDAMLIHRPPAAVRSPWHKQHRDRLARAPPGPEHEDDHRQPASYRQGDAKRIGSR